MPDCVAVEVIAGMSVEVAVEEAEDVADAVAVAAVAVADAVDVAVAVTEGSMTHCDGCFADCPGHLMPGPFGFEHPPAKHSEESLHQ